MKKINRGLLRRMIERGEMEIMHRANFDSMVDGSEWVKAENRKWITAMLTRQIDFDLRSKSGCAYVNDDGTITLSCAGDVNDFRKRVA